MSIRKASEYYCVSLGTLRNRSKGVHSKKAGGQRRLTDRCEKQIVGTIDVITEWKVPFGGLEIRQLVKSYLDARGVTDSSFKNNLHGIDWLNGFMQRHKLTQRMSDNVESRRAEVNSKTIMEYFDNLDVTLEGVEPQNTYNYDETNITDDPRVKKVIVRRGLHRVERKADHSKQSISVMFCRNAVEKYLPPMVVYKAKNTYSKWTESGPIGTGYEATSSGWFDSRTFQIWFVTIFLANVVSKPGVKVLIGDNLQSHFSPQVIEEAQRSHIRFVTMPPNSTHLCQPLDVAVFGPAKRI